MKFPRFLLPIALSLAACGDSPPEDSRFLQAETQGTTEAFESYLGGDTTPENEARAREAIYELMLAHAEDSDLPADQRYLAYAALFTRFERELAAEPRRRYADFRLELLRSTGRTGASGAGEDFRRDAEAHFPDARDVIEEGEEWVAAQATAVVAEGLLNAPSLEAQPAPSAPDPEALGLWRTESGVRARLRNANDRVYTSAAYRLRILSADGSERSVDWPLIDGGRLDAEEVLEATLDIAGLEETDRVIMDPVSAERR